MIETPITRDRLDGMLRALFLELHARGDSANGSDVLAAIEPKLGLSEHDKALTKSGSVRWETNLRYYTTDCVRAGWLVKAKGVWTLTDRGLEALKLPPGRLIREANRLYDEALEAERRLPADAKSNAAPKPPTLPESSTAERTTTFEQAEERSRQEVDEYLEKMDGYDFQHLVAALLRAMGYHVRYIAPPGPDGGIDIIAYRDPLGSSAPRIRVQVKHRNVAADVKEIREMEGLLRKDGDIGLFVSSGGFTKDALREIHSSSRHIDTIDQTRLLNLWQEHYTKLDEEGKAYLPLKPIYFIAPENPVE